jgi:hypothetical protein
MAQTQKGSYGVVWGANVGVAYTAGVSPVVVAASDNLTQDFTMSQDADEVIIKDQVGNTVSKVFYDDSKTISIRVIPIGTTIADANDNGVVPTAGTLVTLELLGTTHDQVRENHTGKYICMPGATLNANNAGQAEINMTLYQNTAADLTSTISAS